ncbi:MAG TPA: molybdopterin-dependent oxidoreductase [Nitrososphaerales archaeon]|nr:molybdopterin-dependent oxidoreductase [Nitrososphaerales archaeon]
MTNEESSQENPTIDKKQLTRRGFIKWTTALGLVGAAVVGLGAGYGVDTVLRPNAEKTITQTETQTKTQTATQTVTSTQTTTVQPPAPAETVLTSQHDGGPFLAHVINGRWVKSEPFLPNLPVAVNTYAARNRMYSPDRIRYPMKRVGWVPGGKSDTSNRGKGAFVRITWQEALDSTAAELQRINTTYGPGAIYHYTGSHQMQGSLQVQTWMSSLLALMGGYTSRVGGTSFVGWADGSTQMWGGLSMFGMVIGIHGSNNLADLLQNCQLLVIWSVDDIRSSIYGGYTGDNMAQIEGLLQLKKAGKTKIVVIDTHHTDTAAMLADQWIPIIPGTDEALAAAIAYVWFTNNKVNTAYLSTHAVGYDETSLPAGAPKNSSFKAYIMGDADGVPKTPQWAAGICGVDATTITNLANDWASKPTFLECQAAGANRREWSGEWVRMMIGLQALMGYLGVPGAGLGSFPSRPDPTPVGMGSFGGFMVPSIIPAIPNPVLQYIHHIQFGKAILAPPISWTTGVTPMSYPATGYSPVKAAYFVGGSASTQMEGPDNYHMAWQSPNLEFIASHHTWWEDTQMYCDIVMPTNTIGEHEDIGTYMNYAIFSHQLVDPLYDSITDLEVVRGLAQRLSLEDKLFLGNTDDQWLQNLYASAKMPATYDDFKAQGYIKFDTTPADTTTTDTGYDLGPFHDDPVKYPLNTPTGKIEFYSTSIAKFYGPDGKTMPAHTAYPANPIAPPSPIYVPATENRNSTLAQKYPLLQQGGGQKFGRHSQWNNMSWLRDDEQTFINGYRVAIMSTADANARGLNYGDVIRVFNDRGQILCAAKPTQRMIPGVVFIFEGGHIKQQQPGVIGSLDMGGDHANLCPTWQAEPICDGIITHSGLVQVEKYTG